MNHPDEELRKAVALFRYGLIADVLRLPLGTIDSASATSTSATRGQNAHNALISGSRKPKVGTTRPRAEGEDFRYCYRFGCEK